MDRKSLGSWGEDKAANYLRRRGYKILERNFSCRFGEIDIIASRGGYLVFVEVKLRKDAAFAQAREFVASSGASSPPRSCGSAAATRTCSPASTL